MTEGLPPEHRSRVLILDDDESQLDTLSAILQDEGFDVVGCQTAAAGIQRLGRGDIDVAIVEPRLSHVDEAQLLDSLAELAEDVTSIIHTGHGSYQSAKRAVNIGAFGFVEKGGDSEELMRQVHRAIRHRLAQRAEGREAAVAERTHELERANEAFRESEASKRAILDAMPDMMFRLSRDGTHLDFHAADPQQLYVPPDQIIGRNVGDLLPADVAAEYMKRIARTFDHQATEVFEYQLEFPEGMHYFEARMVLCGAESVLTIVRDITERRQAEEALRESQERYQTLTEVSPVAVYLTDSLGNCIYANERWLQMTGMTMEDTLGDGWKRGLHPEDQEQIFLEWSRAVRDSRPFEMEYRLKTPDGVITPVFGQAIAERDNDGKITGYVGTLTDITARKRAEETLRQRETYLSTLLDALGDAVFTIHMPERCIAYANRAVTAIFGYLPEDLIGQTTEKFYVSEAGFAEYGRRLQDALARRQDSVNAELQLRHKDGHILWADAQTTFLFEAGQPTAVISVVRDITERKQAERQLRESEEKFRSFVENANDIVYSLSLDGKFTYISPNARELLGHDTSEFLDRHFSDFIHPDDLPSCNESFQSVISTGEKASGIAYRARHQDGSWRWHISNASPRKDESRRVVAFVGISRDVSEQRQAEAALRDGEVQFREVFNHMSSGVAIYNVVGDGEDFVFKDINPAGARIGDMRREEILGRSVQEVFPGVRELGLLDVFREVAQTGRPCHHPVSAYRDERLSQWVENYVCKLPSGEIVAVYDDVTERKQAEEARQRVLTLLEKAEHIGMSGSWSQDVQTGREEWSQGEYSIHSLSPDVSPSHELHLQCVHPEDRDRHDKLFKQHLASDKTHCTQEYRILEEDGKIRHIEASYQIVRDDAGRPLSAHGTDKDITERKLLEEKLRHATKMEAVGQLASGVAHEFNNLLFGILGSAELILATLEGDLPEHVDRPLRDIKKCGRRGAALTKQLLSFARKKTPEISQFDINQMVSDLDTVFQQVSGERITLEVDLASDLRPVEADRGDVEQAIMNLARNARDAMPDGGALTIRTIAEQLDASRVTTNSLARPGLFVRLSVTDTGCGMTPETVERVFEPFFTTKPVGKGTGLGLSTVFADVTKNRGIIEVASRQGEGTEFRVFLPTADEKSAPASENTERLADQFPGGNETILVVDDDQVVLDSAAFLLETQGYSVMRACGGREAIEAAASHTGTIELLLTDVTMPDINGWELAQELTGKRPDTKVIFMSGYAEDVLKAGAAEGEHIEFLQKPPETEALFQRIREILDAPMKPAP